MIDYKLKAEVLKTDLPKIANQIEKAVFAHYWYKETGEIIETKYDISTANELRCFYLEKFGNMYLEAEKINKARYKRVVRLRNRIKSILSSTDVCFFLTLTFNDETLAKTSPDTRRQYVRKFLASSGLDYVANIDFGKKNGREHYHAVLGGVYPDMDIWQKYGFYLAEPIYTKRNKMPKKYEYLTEDLQRIKMQEDNEKRLSKYIAKLTNHAIKETTKRSACIYRAEKKAHYKN